MYYGVWRFFWFQEHAQGRPKIALSPARPAHSADIAARAAVGALDRIQTARDGHDHDADEARREDLAAHEKALHSYGSNRGKRVSCRFPSSRP